MKIEPLEPDRFYHFYNRGNNRENIFREEANYAYFLQLMNKYLTPAVHIYSYCLLPNHFHLVFRTKSVGEMPLEFTEKDKPIWRWFSNFFNAYAKAINKRYGRTGSLFQSHPKRKLIGDEAYLRNALLYVNANAEIHGIASLTEYRHSSYPKLMGADETTLMRKEVFELFHDRENFDFTIKALVKGRSLKFDLDLEE